jgi:hypothetical protein
MKKVATCVASLLCLGSAAHVHANTVVFDFDTEFSMADSPQGLTPWITATFDDMGTPGGVRLTIEATNLDPDEYIIQALFNYSGDASGLSFTAVDISAASPVNGTPVASNDAYQADGAGLADIKFQFENASGSNRFTAGESIVYDISATGLLATDFEVTTTGGDNGAVLAAAQIAGISAPGCTEPDLTCGSGWITPGDGYEPPSAVPVPAAVWLFGSGLLGLVGIGRRARRG